MEIPDEIADALAENIEALHRNEQAAYELLNNLESDEQRQRVIWFMEDLGAIHDAFYLLRLTAAGDFAKEMLDHRHGVACVVGDRVLEVTTRFRERREDDPDPAMLGKSVRA